MFRTTVFRTCLRFTQIHVPAQRRKLATAFEDLTRIEGSIKALEAEIYTGLASPPSQTQDESVHNDSGIKVIHQIDPRQKLYESQLQDGTDEWYAHEKLQQSLTKHLGSSIAPYYKPHQLITNPPRPSEITLELLLASQAHLGHHTSRWNPANAQYIFGIRSGIHIISLEATAAHLRRACRVVSGVTERGGLVLFAGTRPEQERAVVRAAELAGGYHLFQNWRPGSITNGPVMLRQCERKIVDAFDREIHISPQQLAKTPFLKPDLVVCLNPTQNWVLLHECALNNIPTIGVIDTDANPTWVTYPIPANDDSVRSIQVIAGALGRAGEEGQVARREAALRGEVFYQKFDLPDGERRRTGADIVLAKAGLLGEDLRVEVEKEARNEPKAEEIVEVDQLDNEDRRQVPREQLSREVVGQRGGNDRPRGRRRKGEEYDEEPDR